MRILLVALCFVLNTCNGIENWNVFSTKTPYKWMQASQHKDVLEHADNVTIDGATCSAKYVNMVLRHGARYPTLSNLKKIKKLHEKIVENKDPSKFLELNSWNFTYDLTLEGQLVPEGAKEQQELGIRAGLRFSTLIQENSGNIQFVSSSKSRAKDSAKYFYDGLAALNYSLGPFSVQINDTAMKFYDGCLKYETLVEGNKTNLKEFYDYEKTPAFLNVIESTKTRLGLNVSLTSMDIYLIYDFCSHETYIFNVTIWCDLLTDADRSVLEYGQDIEKYYESSYGHQFNLRMACPLVGDIFQGMDAVIEQTNSGNLTQDYIAAKFQFGHAETIIPLLTALGLFNDSQPLLATDKDSMVNRTFQTSNISPYSANIAIVMYACDTEKSQNTTYTVMFYVNEVAISIPACSSIFCPYHIVRAAYQDMINQCDIFNMCKMEETQ